MISFFPRLDSFVACGLVLLLSAVSARAAEISSNGLGGGAWSDPATWRGKMPGPKDDVIIQKHDVVVFDRNDDAKLSCRKLQLDPKGMLTFKTGGGKQIMCVSEAIDCYGIIKLDGTKSANDHLELRMLGDGADKRKIKLGKGAALLLYGKANLPDDRRNVGLTSPSNVEPLASVVEADGVVSIDWQRAFLKDIKLAVKKLDNTGAKPGERLNLIDNQFTGLGRVWLQACDSPVIAKNTFEHKGTKPLDEAAVNLSYCPLAEIKGNTIRGGFLVGITVNYQSDSVLIGNTVEKCTAGITGGYGIPSTMIKRCIIKNCETGIRLEGASGVVEDTLVDGAVTSFHHQNANLQLTNFEAKNPAPKGNIILFETGTLTLLNCNLTPAQIKVGAQPATVKNDPITCLQYTVVGVKGAPADALVELRTAALTADANDSNVRNSPAPLTAGLTPLPRTLNPLIVKAWTIDIKGMVQPGPEYSVKVLGPAAKEGDVRPTLKTMMFRPKETHYRGTPDDSNPTVEVNLK